MTIAPVTTPARSIWRAGLLTVVVAAVANTVVYLLGLLTPASYQVEQQGQVIQVPFFMPAVATLMGVGAGVVALRVLARFSWGPTVWTVAAVLVGLGSVAQPLAAAADAWTAWLLAAMHVVALGAALVLLRPAVRRSV